ncbi:permease-like cell division protein FtsX [Lactococcus kimchii]|uniref:permease-like cell division protein FtsX n=1 Tax=Lactococcus sp. S-13 TaxID=2507158 RepID=UPI001023419E|nr:permease-like cell division protein FtsX [Lactococcus sp. S-13]RZI48359.1 ABC transporter permease [Lactococcus sp. S-13]
MIRNFFKHIGESLKNLKRNGWMTVAAVSSVMITLVLVGLFLSLIMNTTKLAKDIEGNVRVVAYMKLDVHDQDKEIQDPKDAHKMIANPNHLKVYEAINKVPNVEKVTFSSKQAQLNQLTKSLGKAWELFKGDANPLYDAYIVEADSPKHIKQVTAAVKKIPGVGSATYGGANTNRIFSIARVVRTWGFAAAGLLLFVAIFLISNTIRITIMSRQREIQIMRLVGAKNGYIRWPFFLEGAWVGLLGAVLPSLLIAWLYRIAFISFTPSLQSQNLSMYAPDQFIPQMIGIMVVIGVLIGSFGALLSMRRFLKV